jgi:hypothetical protein
MSGGWDFAACVAPSMGGPKVGEIGFDPLVHGI